MLDKRDNFDEILKRRYDEFHAEVPAWNELFVEEELSGVQKRTLFSNRVLAISAIAAIFAVGLFLGITFVGDNAKQSVQSSVVASGDKYNTPMAIIERDNGDDLGGLSAKLNDTIKKQSRILITNAPKQTNITTEVEATDLPKTEKQRADSSYNKRESQTKTSEKIVTQNAQAWSNNEPRYKKRGKISLLAATSLMSSSGSQSALSTMKLYEAPMAINISNYRNSVNFEKDDYKHKFPVNVALVVNYEFFDHLSVSSGLNYSYLESSAESVDKLTYSLTQRVNYLGIPIALNYDFLKRNRFSVYGSVGGMVELNVGATNEIKSYSNGKLVHTQKNKIKINNALFSIQCGVGARYNIIDTFGIFIEPGINYVFSNISQPITYRTKTPLQFNLRVGLSINI